MLMRCLEAGGLTPVYDKLSDTMNHSAPSDYIPNPNGFYQFTGQINPSFYEQYKSNLIKYPIKSITNLPIGNYKVILLLRDPKEIRKSMDKWTPYSSWGMDEAITYIYDKFINEVKKYLIKRKDVELLILNYKDIVNSPLESFTVIQSAGWPIDINKCVSNVDASLYRNKLEKDKK